VSVLVSYLKEVGSILPDRLGRKKNENVRRKQGTPAVRLIDFLLSLATQAKHLIVFVFDMFIIAPVCSALNFTPFRERVSEAHATALKKDLLLDKQRRTA
jgi:hypothetical protein